MSAGEKLRSKMAETIRLLAPVKHAHHLTNWLQIVREILMSGSATLNKIALYLLIEAMAEGRIDRIRRWLKNPHMDVWAFYRPPLSSPLSSFCAQFIHEPQPFCSGVIET